MKGPANQKAEMTLKTHPTTRDFLQSESDKTEGKAGE